MINEDRSEPSSTETILVIVSGVCGAIMILSIIAFVAAGVFGWGL